MFKKLSRIKNGAKNSVKPKIEEVLNLILEKPGRGKEQRLLNVIVQMSLDELHELDTKLELTDEEQKAWTQRRFQENLKLFAFVAITNQKIALIAAEILKGKWSQEEYPTAIKELVKKYFFRQWSRVYVGQKFEQAAKSLNNSKTVSDTVKAQINHLSTIAFEMANQKPPFSLFSSS